MEPDKCEFLKQEIPYLGHVITSDGVKPDTSKIKGTREFRLPKYEHDIKSFLGLPGYYHKLIEDFSKITKPLIELLNKRYSLAMDR